MGIQLSSKACAGEPQLPEDVRVILAEALDSVMDLIATNELAIFETIGSRKRFFFDLLATEKRRFRKPRPCIFPGCREISVPASHTVQRNGPLAVIAEENHVLSPEVSLRNRKLDMAGIGIGEASTFPGVLHST